MPLEFEENSRVENQVAASPFEEPSEAEREFVAAWKEKQYKLCLELFPKLPDELSDSARRLLVVIALHSQIMAPHAAQLRKECLRRYLMKSPAPYLLMELKSLLFDKDPEVQEIAFQMYQWAGRAAFPPLMALQSRLQSLNPRTKANQRGVVHLMRLFGELKDPRCMSIPGEVLLGKSPKFGHVKMFRNALKYGGWCVVASWLSIIGGFIGIGPYFGGDPAQMPAYVGVVSGVASFLYGVSMLGVICCWGSALFLAPFVFSGSRKAFALFQEAAVAAMESIGDKRALLYLMPCDKGVDATPRIHALVLALLPLVSEKDREWLGDSASDWMKSRIRYMGGDAIFLRSVGTVGDERLISPLKRIISYSKHGAAREEAIRALAALEARRDTKKENG